MALKMPQAVKLADHAFTNLSRFFTASEGRGSSCSTFFFALGPVHAHVCTSQLFLLVNPSYPMILQQLTLLLIRKTQKF